MVGEEESRSGKREVGERRAETAVVKRRCADLVSDDAFDELSDGERIRIVVGILGATFLEKKVREEES